MRALGLRRSLWRLLLAFGMVALAGMLYAERMVPGWRADGEVSISNSGDEPGQFRLALTHLRETPGARGARLSDSLWLEVTEIDGSRRTTVYSGRLSHLGVRDVSMLELGERRGYRLKMSFPDTGPHGADNPVQGGRVKASFLWTAAPAP